MKANRQKLVKAIQSQKTIIARLVEDYLSTDGMQLFRMPDDYRDGLSNCKYFCIKGGRGAVKSFSVAEYLIEQSFHKKYSGFGFLCAREVQKSIEDSVYGLIKMLIHQAQLEKFFKFKSSEIINTKTNVRFVFTGLRATGGATASSQLNKIKGKVGLKIIWVDESQDLSEEVINVLFPTVNRGSQGGLLPLPWLVDEEEDNLDTRMFFTMNVTMPTDPIIAKLDTLREESRIIHVNLFDLPEEFQDPQLVAQAKAEENEEYYPHVWLGKPLSLFGGFPFANFDFITDVDASKVNVFCAFLDPSFKGGDFTAICFLGEYNDELISFGYCYSKAWNDCIDDIKGLIKTFAPDVFWYEDNSLGTAPQNELSRHGVIAIPKTSFYNKHSRIYKAATFTRGKVTIIKNLSNSAFLTNLAQYHGEKSKFDDGADSYGSVIIHSGIVADKIKW